MDIETAIKNILVNDLFVHVSLSDIDIDDGLRDKLGVDSLGFSELRAQCQQIFGVQITDDDFNPKNFSSVRSLAGLINKLGAAA